MPTTLPTNAASTVYAQNRTDTILVGRCSLYEYIPLVVSFENAGLRAMKGIAATRLASLCDGQPMKKKTSR